MSSDNAETQSPGDAPRRVLMVACFFPPIGGTAVIRALKFAKYLPGYGWNADVLTTSAANYIATDEALLDEVPETTRVVRTGFTDVRPAIDVVRRVGKPVRDLLRRSSTGGAESEEIDDDPAADGEVRIESAPRPGFSALPDNFVGWYPHAVRAGLRAVREFQPEVIFSTSSPYTSHFVARRLKERTGLPWVADFRDPWLMARPGDPRTRRQRIDAWFEARVLRDADRVVNTSEPWAAAQRARHGYPDDDPRFVVIPNGFDAEDFDRIERAPQPGRTRICYLGTLRDHRSPREFLIALARVLAARPELREGLSVEFIGPMFDPPGAPSNSALVARLGLDEIVVVKGYVPHGRIAEEMRTMSGLLLLIGNYSLSEGTFSGKIFEYLATGLPIFSVVPDGGVAHKLLDEAGCGETAPYGCVAGIAPALERYLDRLRSGSGYPEPPPLLLERYRRRRLTARLAELLDEVADARNPAHT